MTNRIDKWADRKIGKPKVVKFSTLSGVEKAVFKKYPIRVTFIGTIFEKKLNKRKELRLKQINKKIDELVKESVRLFK